MDAQGRELSTVMLGEAAAVIGETQFNAIGFLICLSAAAVSAIRWVVAQKVMHSPSSNKYGLHHPVILLYHAMFFSYDRGDVFV